MKNPEIKKILVAIDFSEITGAVISHGIYLAKAFDAQLKLLHVVHVPSLSEATSWMTPTISSNVERDIRTQVHSAVEAKLNEISDECGESCRGIEAIIREGVPFEQIIECAEAQEVDLIVLGTHGRTGLTHTIIGSVAERVVRRAPCSVFCINPLAIADDDKSGSDSQ